MASIIKANELQDFGGNSIITSDGAGNLTLNNSAMKATPAFAARNSSAQAISSATMTLLQFDTEIFDSDGTYTNSSTFKFTPGVSGKYFIYSSVDLDGITDQAYVLMELYKNGSAISLAGDTIKSINFSAKTENNQTFLTAIVDANTTDYFQIYGYHSASGSKNTRTDYGNIFGAYKIIGA
jgi:hypothetical protein